MPLAHVFFHIPDKSDPESRAQIQVSFIVPETSLRKSSTTCLTKRGLQTYMGDSNQGPVCVLRSATSLPPFSTKGTQMHLPPGQVQKKSVLLLTKQILIAR